MTPPHCRSCLVQFCRHCLSFAAADEATDLQTSHFGTSCENLLDELGGLSELEDESFTLQGTDSEDGTTESETSGTRRPVNQAAKHVFLECPSPPKWGIPTPLPSTLST